MVRCCRPIARWPVKEKRGAVLLLPFFRLIADGRAD